MSYRQTKLPDLITQANPQELLTHFIFFKLKERATYLKTSFFPEIQSIKEKYHISKGGKKSKSKCRSIYKSLSSILCIDVCLITSYPSFPKKHHYLETVLRPTVNDLALLCWAGFANCPRAHSDGLVTSPSLWYWAELSGPVLMHCSLHRALPVVTWNLALA